MENDLRTKLEPPFGNRRLHTLGILVISAPPSKLIVLLGYNHMKYSSAKYLRNAFVDQGTLPEGRARHLNVSR